MSRLWGAALWRSFYFGLGVGASLFDLLRSELEGYKLPLSKKKWYLVSFHLTFMYYGQNTWGRYASKEENGEDIPGTPH
jgi:hypothetical protein